MKSPQRHHIEKLFAEGLKVRAVAETSRADGHHLSSFAEKFGGERQEACVEIACFDAGLAQQASRVRIAVNLAVGRVENGSVEWRLGCAKQIAAHGRDGSLNKIFAVKLRRKLNPASATLDAARAQCSLECVNNRLV